LALSSSSSSSSSRSDTTSSSSNEGRDNMTPALVRFEATPGYLHTALAVTQLQELLPQVKPAETHGVYPTTGFIYQLSGYHQTASTHSASCVARDSTTVATFFNGTDGCYLLVITGTLPGTVAGARIACHQPLQHEDPGPGSAGCCSPWRLQHGVGRLHCVTG
jgi:hypothetical protein